MGQPVLPVSALASVPYLPVQRTRALQDVDVQVIARLVRTRLMLERARPWAMIGSIGFMTGSVVLCFTLVQSPSILRALAVTVPTALAGTSLLVDKLGREAFLHLARGEGLSHEAALAIFETALGADHWIGVLESCGRPPSDAEVAAFVLSR